ncbi:MAG TPA: hypothetical protein VF548_03025 [Allosphingosinicella sp.]
MKFLTTLVLAAAILAAPRAAAAPTAPPAAPAPSIALGCDSGAAAPASAGETPNLGGHWDFLMVPRGMASFGLMSIGLAGADYGGALAPSRTAPVVLRRLTLTGNRIHMVVASTEGDVLFDGTLSAKGDLMCGTVTYHGGETFPMVAQKRPSTYQPQPQAQQAVRR